MATPKPGIKLECHTRWTRHWFFLGSGGVVPDQPPPLATQDVTRRRFPHSHSGIFKIYFTYHLTLFILSSKAPSPHPSQLPQACQVPLLNKKTDASASWYIVSISQEMVIINLLYWKRHWTSICWKSGIWHCRNEEDQEEGRWISRKWCGPTDNCSGLFRMEWVVDCMLPKYLSLGVVKKENQFVNSCQDLMKIKMTLCLGFFFSTTLLSQTPNILNSNFPLKNPERI